VKRPSTDALWFAVDWIGSYEADEDDSNAQHRDALVKWLKALVTKAERDQAIKDYALDAGLARSAVQRALRDVRSEKG